MNKNIKYLIESFFDDIEDDVLNNVEQLTQKQVLKIITSNTSLLESEDEDDIVDYFLHICKIEKLVECLPLIFDKMRESVQLGRHLDAFSDNLFKSVGFDIEKHPLKYTYKNGYTFYKSNHKLTPFSIIIDFNIVKIQYHRLYLDCLEISDIHVVGFDRHSITPHIILGAICPNGASTSARNMSIVNSYNKELGTLDFKNIFKQLVNQCIAGGSIRILEEINKVSTIVYTITQKDITRMLNCFSTDKWSGYTAINKIDKKIARIAAMYIIKEGTQTKWNDEMLLNWLVWRTGLMRDWNEKLGAVNRDKIYFRDIVNSVNSYNK